MSFFIPQKYIDSDSILAGYQISRLANNIPLLDETAIPADTLQRLRGNNRSLLTEIDKLQTRRISEGKPAYNQDEIRTLYQRPDGTYTKSALSGTGFGQSTQATGSNNSPVLTDDQFKDAIAKECIKGSGIGEKVFNSSVTFLSGLNTDISGNVETPIHDALGWRVTRFGHQVKETLFAASFNQETGDPWQLKLSNPRVKNLKFVKYETPTGNGSRAYLPPIPTWLRLIIGARYSVTVPREGSFWDWLELHPEIPIVITEGAKKALCLLGFSVIAISLTGVNGGYRTTQHGVALPAPELIPDLERFAAKGRKIIMAFDRDSKPETVKKVNAAIWKTAKLLTEKNCDVAIARWDNANGRDKGIDDLVVNQGLEAWTKAYDNAKSLTQWQVQDRYSHRLVKYKPTIAINVPDLSTAIARETFPKTGIVAIISDYGTGKTKLLMKLTEGNNIVKLGHRISLERNAATVINLSFLNDLDSIDGKWFNRREKRFLTEAEIKRIAGCFESILKIKPEQVDQGDLILDEADQGLRALLTSATCKKNGKRPLLLRRLEQLIKAAERVILLSADLGDREIDYICRLRDESPSMVLLNEYQRPRGDCRFIKSNDDSAIVAEILTKAKNGEKLLIFTDSLTRGKAIAKLLAPVIGNDAIFQFNSQTSGSDQGLEFSTIPNQFVADNPHIKVAIITPSGFTGLSLTFAHFDEVCGVFYGRSVITDDCMQSLERDRSPIPRTVWAAETGKLFSKAGTETNPIDIKRNLKSLTNLTAELLRAELNPEKLDTLKHYKWEDNPHLDLFAEYEADRNFSMWHFRDCLQVRLSITGYKVDPIELAEDETARDSIKAAIEEIKLEDAIATAHATKLTEVEAEMLEAKETLTIDEQLALDKYHLAQWYVIEDIAVDDVLSDRKGRTKKQLQRLEYLVFPELAKSADTKTIDEGTPKDHTATPWDFGVNEIQRKTLEFIGFYEFMSYALKKDTQWSKDTVLVQAIATKCKEHSPDIKKVLGFNPAKMTECAIVAALIELVGLKNPNPDPEKLNKTSDRHRVNGKLVYFYQLDFEYLEKVKAILRRRAERLANAGVTPVLHPIFIKFIEGVEQLKTSHKSEQNDPPINSFPPTRATIQQLTLVPC